MAIIRHEYYYGFVAPLVPSYFTCPSGVTSVLVQCVGPGGLGQGGGGGGGAYAESICTNLIPGVNYQIFVGGIAAGNSYFVGQINSVLAVRGGNANGGTGGLGGQASACIGDHVRSGGRGGNGGLGGGGGGGNGGAEDGGDGSDSTGFLGLAGGPGGPGSSSKNLNDLSVNLLGSTGGNGGDFGSNGNIGTGLGAGGGGAGLFGTGAFGFPGLVVISYLLPDDSPNIPNIPGSPPLMPINISYSGEIYGVGNNGLGIMGIAGADITSLTQLSSISSSGIITDIAAGPNLSVLYVFDNTKIISAGGNSEGQCGQSGITDPAPIAYMIYDNDSDAILSAPGRIFQSGIAASAGTTHSLVLDSSGSVWACGNGANGRLGIGSTTDRSWLVPSFSGLNYGGKFKAAKAVAGGNFSLLLDEFGRLFVCGANVNSQLGQTGGGPTSWAVNTSASGAFPILDMAGGSLTSYIISSVSGLMAAGSNSVGQHGVGSTVGANVFVKVSGLDGVNVVKVVAGADFAICMSSSGTVYSWGQGTSGKTGLNTTSNVLIPTRVSGLLNVNVIDIAAATTNGFAIDSSGSVYGWGDNNHGQLGSGSLGAGILIAQKMAGSGVFRFLHNSKSTDLAFAYNAPNTQVANFITNNDMDLFIRSDPSSSIDLSFTPGPSGNANLFIQGDGDTIENSINLYASGSVVPSSEMLIYLATIGHSAATSIDSNINLYITGVTPTTESGILNLFHQGSESNSNNIDLFENGKDNQSGICNLFISTTSFKNNDLTLSMSGSISGTNFSWSIEDFVQLDTYNPQLICDLDFVGSSGDVTIQIWELQDGVPNEIHLSNSGCYPLGDSGSWGFSLEYLPITDYEKPQYHYRMTDPLSNSCQGHFFLRGGPRYPKINGIYLKHII